MHNEHITGWGEGVKAQSTECQAFSSVVRICSPRHLTLVMPPFGSGGGGGGQFGRRGRRSGTLGIILYNPSMGYSIAQWDKVQQ
jgi:hypothetical protein